MPKRGSWPAIVRFRVLIAITRDTRFFPMHGAAIYGAIAEAQRLSAGGAPAVPDGFMPDAVEQGRLLVRAGEHYAFGFTWIGRTAAECGRRVARLLDGFGALGRARPLRPSTFGGNFEILQVEDLVAKATWRTGDEPDTVTRAHVDAEVERLTQAPQLSIRFVSPLRTELPGAERKSGQGFFDGRTFHANLLLRRLVNRLDGLAADDPSRSESDSVADFSAPALEVVRNRLTWVDLPYGAENPKKSLGGAVGRIELRVLRPEAIEPLVEGQYTRVGRSTRFGLGSYRILELGRDPFEVRPAVDPLRQAFPGEVVAAVAAEHDLPAGALQAAVERVLAGQYAPSPATHLTIAKGSEGGRTLAIPARLDRALQQIVLRQVGPTLDAFFERSSFAYRTGLGRRNAALAIRRAFRQGYRYALKADFRKFFDSIDHGGLEDRLEAYLADEPLRQLLMTWVRSAAPSPGRGIPTGAPISPLLGNLFLDVFDEEVARSGGYLVRYADDFLVLYRSQADADRVFAVASDAAERLLLALNAAKTASLDLAEPFEFLGYRFECTERWTKAPTAAPSQVEDLGWQEAKRAAAEDVTFRLPGEISGQPQPGPVAAIAGPGVALLSYESDHLSCVYRDAARRAKLHIDHLDELVLVGPATIERSALTALLERSVRVDLVDDLGRHLGALTPDTELEDADLVRAQIACAEDAGRRLEFARRLVAAKLWNYGALADCTQAADSDPALGPALRGLSADARSCATVERLLGIEGAGAAKWYGDFQSRLPAGWTFERRVAPSAADPVNIMLNFAQTALYRQCVRALRGAGLAPALGILHRTRAGHAALASDIQEPFRHLMDRAVLVAALRMRPSAFQPTADERFPLRIDYHGSRTLAASVYGALSVSAVAVGESEYRSYRRHLDRQAQSVRQGLVAANAEWWAFQSQ